MTLDPISIATRGYVCDTRPEPIAIATVGYVCIALPVPPAPVDDEIGGDPDGAWEHARLRFQRFLKIRGVRRTIARDEIDLVHREIADDLVAIAAAAEELRDEQEALEARIEFQIELERTRADVLDLERLRMERRLEELRLELEVAVFLQREREEEQALLLAIVAILID